MPVESVTQQLEPHLLVDLGRDERPDEGVTNATGATHERTTEWGLRSPLKGTP